MIYIAHRGNTRGPCPSRENSPDFIKEAIKEGYQVEIDVWYEDGEFFLGHDKPTHKTDYNFLIQYRDWLYCHAKNIEAMIELTRIQANCFGHDSDSFVITSYGKVWAYPGKEIKGCISVLPERNKLNKLDLLEIGVVGVCSDYISLYKED